MKKTKIQKGITLIALIITIIILLILAVVTIGSIKNSNIIAYAQNSAERYNIEKAEENTTLGEYENEISKYYSSNGNGDDNTKEGILWAVKNDEEDDIRLFFIGNVQELILNSLEQEVKAYVLTYNEDADDYEFNKDSQVATVKIDDTINGGLILSPTLNESSSIETLKIAKDLLEVDGMQMDIEESCKNIILLDGCTTIGKEMWKGDSVIETITVPDSIISIGGDAFKNCENLTSVMINKSTNDIKAMANYPWGAANGIIKDINNNIVN